jgi:mRNA interferase MazF
MKKGDIVLLSFPFTDLKGKKIRPALVLVVSDLDVIVAFITTQFKWQNAFDILLEPDESNGLKKLRYFDYQKSLQLTKI